MATEGEEEKKSRRKNASPIKYVNISREKIRVDEEDNLVVKSDPEDEEMAESGKQGSENEAGNESEESNEPEEAYMLILTPTRKHQVKVTGCGRTLGLGPAKERQKNSSERIKHLLEFSQVVNITPKISRKLEATKKTSENDGVQSADNVACTSTADSKLVSENVKQNVPEDKVQLEAMQSTFTKETEKLPVIGKNYHEEYPNTELSKEDNFTEDSSKPVDSPTDNNNSTVNETKTKGQDESDVLSAEVSSSEGSGKSNKKRKLKRKSKSPKSSECKASLPLSTNKELVILCEKVPLVPDREDGGCSVTGECKTEEPMGLTESHEGTSAEKKSEESGSQSESQMEGTEDKEGEAAADPDEEVMPTFGSPEQLSMLNDIISSLNEDCANLTTERHLKVSIVSTPKKRKAPSKGNTPAKRSSARSRKKPRHLESDSDEEELLRSKAKRRKIKKSGRQPSNPASSTAGGYMGDSEQDSDENPLSILDPASEDEKEMDSLLEARANKAGLSVNNVKAMLKAVATDVDFWSMVQNTVSDSPEKECPSPTYEPKMTRRRLKEAIQQGDVPLSHLSPIKHPAASTSSQNKLQSLLSMSFSDEEDEEYVPSNNEAESGDESNSSLASSPCVATPRTPVSMSESSQDASFGQSPAAPTKATLGVGSPMGPPPAPNTKRRRLMPAFEEAEAAYSETIALRTRSKLQLDKPLEEIEAAFVPPDITPDMYDLPDPAEIDMYDKEWQEFLFVLNKEIPKDPPEPVDDDTNDPEYNFIEEEKQEKQDKEEIRSDRAVNVSRKELNELLAELFDEGGILDEKEIDRMRNKEKAEKAEKVKAASEKQSSLVEKAKVAEEHQESESDEDTDTFNKPAPLLQVPCLTEIIQLSRQTSPTGLRRSSRIEKKEKYSKLVKDLIKKQEAREATEQELRDGFCQASFRAQIEVQMRKHVQLLTQMVVLTKGEQEYSSAADFYTGLLTELQKLGKASGLENSAFYSANLTGALELIKEPWLAEENKTTSEEPPPLDYRRGYMLEPLTRRQMEEFATNRSFVYPELLPEGKLLPVEVNNQRKIFFTKAEDNMLAMGLYGFRHIPEQSKLFTEISTHMIPAKTASQLQIRAKNLRAKATGDTAIKFYKQHKKLPDFPRYTEATPLDEIKRPEETPELMPKWFEKKLMKLRHPEIKKGSPGVTSEEEVGNQVIDIYLKPVRVELQRTSPQSGSDEEVKETCGKKPGNPEEEGAETPKGTKPRKRAMRKKSSVDKQTPLQKEKTGSGRQTPSQEDKNTAGGQSPAPQESDGNVSEAVPSPCAVQSPGGGMSGLTMFRVTTGRSASPLVTSAEQKKFSGEEEHQNHASPAASKTTEESHTGTTTQTQCFGSLNNSLAVPVISSQDGDITQEAKSIIAQAMTITSDIQTSEASEFHASPIVNFTSSINPVNTIATGLASHGPVSTSQIYQNSAQTSLVITPAPNMSINPHGNTTVSPLEITLGDVSISPQTAGVSPTSLVTNQSITATSAGCHVSTGVTCSLASAVSTSAQVITCTSIISGAPKPTPVVISASDQLQQFRAEILAPVDTVTDICDNTDTDSSKRTPRKRRSSDQDVVYMIQPPVIAQAPTNTQTAATVKPSSSVQLLASMANVILPEENSKTTDASTGTEVKGQKAQSVSSNCDSTVDSNPRTPEPNVDIIGTKSSYEIVAAVAQYMNTPVKSKPDEGKVVPPVRKCHTSPRTRSQRRLAARAQPPGATTPSPPKLSIPASRRGASPRKKQNRQALQQKARALIPKGFSLHIMTSPTKKAADQIKAKASRRNRNKLQLSPKKAPSTLQNKSPRLLLPKFISDGLDEAGENSQDSCLSDDAQPSAGKGKKMNKGSSSGKAAAVDEERDVDVEGCDADSQEEEEDGDLMEELMRASSTIKFDTKKSHQEERGRKKTKKDTAVDMLAPDLIDSDPLRDERDTAFAQAYLLRVKQKLQTNRDQYGAFLKLLSDFGKSEASPVQLYEDICAILSPFPELVADFAGFLLPDQAHACGCLMTNLEFNRARTFLRKVEVHFARRPSQFQQIMKAFTQWQGLSKHNAQDLKDAVIPLLKGHTHLLEEFSLFFEDERPPESHLTECEEVVLSSDEEKNERYLDGVEEVDMPFDEDDSRFGTEWCPCSCHGNNAGGDNRWTRRKRHCMACGIKVIKGRLYLQTGKILKPLGVRYLDRPKMVDREDQADTDAYGVDTKEDESPPGIKPPKPKGKWWLKKKRLKVKYGGKKKSAKKKEKSEEPEGAADDATNQEGATEETHVAANSPMLAISPLETIFEDAVLTPESSVAQDSIDMPKDFSALREEIRKGQETQSECEKERDSAKSDLGEGGGKRTYGGASSCAQVVGQDLMLSDSNKKNDPGEWVRYEADTTSHGIGNCEVGGSGVGPSHSVDKNELGNDSPVKKKKECVESGGKKDSRIVLKINLTENRSQRMKKFDDGTYEPADSTSTSLLHESLIEHTSCDTIISVGSSTSVLNSSEVSVEGDCSRTMESSCSYADALSQQTEVTAGACESIGSLGDSPKLSTSMTSEGDLSSNSSMSWTREEDRLILQKCKEEGAVASTFSSVAQQLENRTTSQVSMRFSQLLTIISQQDTTDGDSSGPESDQENIT